MSRIAKLPIIVPVEVDIKIDGKVIIVKGKKGQITRILNSTVLVNYTNNILTFFPRTNDDAKGWAQAGTARALLNSMIIGVTEGFIRKLQLVGIGYRATVERNIINLSLGFSHPISYKLPEGVLAQCPSQTDIVLKGIDKQVIGQVAADLRAYRRPEPYKGKGVRYDNEIIHLKETKKK